MTLSNLKGCYKSPQASVDAQGTTQGLAELESGN